MCVVEHNHILQWCNTDYANVSVSTENHHHESLKYL